MTQEEYDRKRKMRLVCCTRNFVDYNKIRTYCNSKFPTRINHYQIAYNSENEPTYYYFYNLTSMEFSEILAYAIKENI